MSANTLARRFTYNGWANREVLRSLESQSTALPDRALTILGHIVGAERRWFARLGLIAEPELSLPIWPTYSLSEIAAILDGFGPEWPATLAAHLAAVPDAVVHYKISTGEPFSTSVGDILEHVLLHGAYHRGQIATLLGRAGLVPAATDFVLWVRLGEPAQ